VTGFHSFQWLNAIPLCIYHIFFSIHWLINTLIDLIPYLLTYWFHSGRGREGEKPCTLGAIREDKSSQMFVSNQRQGLLHYKYLVGLNLNCKLLASEEYGLDIRERYFCLFVCLFVCLLVTCWWHVRWRSDCVFSLRWSYAELWKWQAHVHPVQTPYIWLSQPLVSQPAAFEAASKGLQGYFFFICYFFLLLCYVGVHCDIYKVLTIYQRIF
jgi:hypothetical protein